MQMAAADVGRYPKLAHYVQHDLPRIVHAPSIVRAMAKIGQIRRARLLTALRWGHGPRIKVTKLVGAVGEFTPGIKSDEIRIDTDLVRDFETGKGVRKAKAGNVYLVGVTLLHELVHWGDDQDGLDRPGEEGEELERLIYGKIIH